MQVDVITRIVRNNALPGAISFGPDTDLLESGVLDSLGVIGLIADLDLHLGCRIAPEAVLPENFRTVSNILRTAELSFRNPS